jgi:hypothetical protein
LYTPNNAIYGYLSTYTPIVPEDAEIAHELKFEQLGLEVKDGI